MLVTVPPGIPAEPVRPPQPQSPRQPSPPTAQPAQPPLHRPQPQVQHQQFHLRASASHHLGQISRLPRLLLLTRTTSGKLPAPPSRLPNLPSFLRRILYDSENSHASPLLPKECRTRMSSLFAEVAELDGRGDALISVGFLFPSAVRGGLFVLC